MVGELYEAGGVGENRGLYVVGTTLSIFAPLGVAGKLSSNPPKNPSPYLLGRCVKRLGKFSSMAGRSGIFSKGEALVESFLLS